MRFRTFTAAAGVLAAGLAAGGCGSASPVPGPVITDSTAPAVNGSPAAPVSDAPSTAAPSPGAQAGGNGGICQPQNLTFALSGKATTPGYPGQKRQAVDLTNTGSSACTMTGFPGVDLAGAARGQPNYTWSLVRQSVHYSRVTLGPGGTAHFTVIYLPQAASDSGGISVAKMVITPPGAFTQAQLTWNQTVVLQDGATHPGTYISPVAPGPRPRAGSAGVSATLAVPALEPPDDGADQEIHQRPPSVDGVTLTPGPAHRAPENNDVTEYPSRAAQLASSDLAPRLLAAPRDR